MKSKNTHQTKGRQYCRALKINSVHDYPGIVVDSSGFEGAKIRCGGVGGDYDKNVHRGDYLLIRNDAVIGVLSESEFFHHWEPIGADDHERDGGGNER